MKKKAVITGAHGFLGRHVARHLADKGYSVVGIGHGSWKQEEWSCWGLSAWHACDITLESLEAHCERPFVLVHCAGSGSVPLSLSEPFDDLQRTVVTTAAVLEYIRTASPTTRLVYPSSAGVYGNAVAFPISESSSLAPISPYGTHKRMTEDLISSYARNFNVNSAVIRFFSLYGPGLRKQFIWDACGKLFRNDLRFMGTGQEIRDWLYVEDAASLVAAAVDHASSLCPVVNGGTGVGTSVRELLEYLVCCLGWEKGSLQFSGETRSGDPVRYVADIQRARAWNWEPEKEWKVRVKEYAEWWTKEMGISLHAHRHIHDEGVVSPVHNRGDA